MVSVVDINQRCLYGFRRWYFMVSVVAGNLFVMVSVGFLMVSVVAGKRCLWSPSLDFWWILPPQEEPTFQNVSSDSSLFFVFLGLVSVAGFLVVSVVAGKRFLWFLSLVV